MAPEARNMAMPTRMATRNGMMTMAIWKPSFAEAMKTS